MWSRVVEHVGILLPRDISKKPARRETRLQQVVSAAAVEAALEAQKRRNKPQTLCGVSLDSLLQKPETTTGVVEDFITDCDSAAAVKYPLIRATKKIRYPALMFGV